MSVLKNFQFRLHDFRFSNLRKSIFGTSVKFNFGKFDRVDLHKNIADNVPRLGDSGAPEAGKFQLKYKIKIEKQSVDLLDLAPLLPNRCCLQYFLFSRIGILRIQFNFERQKFSVIYSSLKFHFSSVYFFKVVSPWRFLSINFLLISVSPFVIFQLNSISEFSRIFNLNSEFQIFKIQNISFSELQLNSISENLIE